MVKKNIIKCSQCDEQFPDGHEYRIHWEKEHLYPYLNNEKILKKSSKAS
jgi:uncharacterized C2H2 Zn-finger protein